MTTAYVNGTFLPLEEARVSAMDRGFLFGDGVYEVIPVYNGKLFRFTHHLQRLKKSLQAIRLTVDKSDEQWRELLTELIERNQRGNLSAFIQVTRGASPVRAHPFPSDVTPTIFAFTTALPDRNIDALAAGTKVITLEDTRWKHCHIKATALLPNVLLHQQAIDAGASEAILIDQGRVLEGTSSNVFIVHNGKIITPAKGEKILGGITRELTLELATQHGIPCEERVITEAELLSANEVWITSSTREIMPVTQINNVLINNGKAGPVWQAMIKHYQEYKQSL